MTTLIIPFAFKLNALISRRLLKEKQENEERERCAASGGQTTVTIPSTSPSVLSPSPSSIKSPPPITEEPQEPPEPPEPIGAGLPLLQRLLLLKKKEGEATQSSQPTSPTSITQPPPPLSHLPPPPRSTLVPKNTPAAKTGGKLSFRERLKLHTKDLHNSVKDSVNQPSSNQQTNPSDSSENKSEPPWSKLKKAAIVSDPTGVIVPALSSAQSKDSSSDKNNQQQRSESKPNLVLTRKTKHYR